MVANCGDLAGNGRWRGQRDFLLLGRFAYSADPRFDSIALDPADAVTDRFDIDTTRAARFEPHADSAIVMAVLREQAYSTVAAHLMGRARFPQSAGAERSLVPAGRVLRTLGSNGADPNATDEATGDDPYDAERALAASVCKALKRERERVNTLSMYTASAAKRERRRGLGALARRRAERRG
jgi:hypothetical protein